jgi:outer membrane protein
MKRLLKILLPVLLAVSVLSALPAAAQSKIATIDLRKVFDNYWKRQQAQAALKERGDGFDKQMKGLMDDYKKGQDDYNKLLAAANDQSVTAVERDKRKTSAENKLRELKASETNIRSFEDDARDKIESQKKRMRDTILEDIRAAISAKAKGAGYSLVIDSAADSLNQTPVILYNNGESDMTDSVLTQLNATAPPTATPDSTTKPPAAK